MAHELATCLLEREEHNLSFALSNTDEFCDNHNQYHSHDDKDECYDNNSTLEYGYHVEEKLV